MTGGGRPYARGEIGGNGRQIACQICLIELVARTKAEIRPNRGRSADKSTIKGISLELNVDFMRNQQHDITWFHLQPFESNAVKWSLGQGKPA